MNPKNIKLQEKNWEDKVCLYQLNLKLDPYKNYNQKAALTQESWILRDPPISWRVK